MIKYLNQIWFLIVFFCVFMLAPMFINETLNALITLMQLLLNTPDINIYCLTVLVGLLLLKLVTRTYTRSTQWISYQYEKPYEYLVHLKTKEGKTYYFKSVERFNWLRDDSSSIHQYKPIRYIPIKLQWFVMKIQDKKALLIQK